MLRTRVPRPAAWPAVVLLAIAMVIAAAPAATAAPAAGVPAASAEDETGSLAGTVSTGGVPLADVYILVETPDAGWGASTRPDGTYLIGSLPPDTYTVQASLLGYRTASAPVTVVAGARATLDFELSPLPRHTVSGHVRDESGAPVAGATVLMHALDLPPVTTDAGGAYRIPDVVVGEWTMAVDGARCLWPDHVGVTVAGDTTVDVVLAAKRDLYGHTCTTEPTGPADWVAAGDPLPLSGYTGTVAVDLPFQFNLFEQSYGSVYVALEGYLSFATAGEDLWAPPPYLPQPGVPDAAVHVMSGDLFVPADGRVRAGTIGAAPHREFVVTWENVTLWEHPELRFSFQAALGETGRIVLRYQGIDDPAETGESTATGIEDETGEDGIPYAVQEPFLADDTAVVFDVPGTGFVNGVVTDANDGRPVRLATVGVRQRGAADRVVRTDDQGRYQVRARPGAARLRFAAADYAAVTRTVTVPGARTFVRRDAALRTARLGASASGLEFVVPPGRARRSTITITNSGGAPADWTVREVGDGPRRAAVTDHRTAGPVPARILRSWPATGVRRPWGVGYQDGVWISDAYGDEPRNVRFTDAGTRDLAWDVEPWSAPRDMASVPDRGLICQVGWPGLGITCWNAATGAVRDRIGGVDLPWTQQPQLGLAYRPDDDSFYVGGDVDGIIYHIRGLSHRNPGAVIGQCRPEDWTIVGLGWNRTHRALWMASWGWPGTIHQLDPATCAAVRTVTLPTVAPYAAAGLDADPLGNLWLVSHQTVYQVDAGLPEANDVPWLRVRPVDGRLAPGASAALAVTVDAGRLPPGVYTARLVLAGDSGREPQIVLPIRLEVRA